MANYSTDFNIGDKVQFTESAIKMNAGKQINGAKVQSIIIDQNGIWYELIYNTSDGGMNFKTTKARAFMIESIDNEHMWEHSYP